jgi:hypothetical protein
LIAFCPASVIFMRTTSTGRPPGDYPLGRGDREAGNTQIHQQGHWKAVCEHDRFRAAVGGGGEQFERSAALGLGGGATHVA